VSFRKHENISLYGASGLPARELFRQRRGYGALYPSSDDPTFPKPINFRNPKQSMYGLLSPEKEHLVCDSAYLAQVPGTTKSIYALNFVVDAYRDFLFYMNTKGTVKMMNDEGRLKAEMTAKKGWTNPDLVYQDLQTALYESFVENYLNVKLKAKIKDFNTFADVFMNFYLNFLDYSIPVTYTGMLQSSYSTPLFSGLCIEMEDASHDEDFLKFDKYVNNKNFEEYAIAAAAYGFMLDQNAPWRLVANINSPKMRKYMDNNIRLYKMPRQGVTEHTTTPYLEDGSTHAHQYYIDEYGNGFTDEHVTPYGTFGANKNHRHKIIDYKIIPAATPKGNDPTTGIEPHVHKLQIAAEKVSLKDFYDFYYFRTQEIDLQNLKDMLLDMYERFVGTFPFAAVPLACHLSKNIYDYVPDSNFLYDPLKVKRLYRKDYSKQQYEKDYNDLFFYKLYFNLRLRELRADVSQARITKNLAKIEDLYLNVDKEYALSYIMQYLNQFQ